MSELFNDLAQGALIFTLVDSGVGVLLIAFMVWCFVPCLPRIGRGKEQAQ